MLWGEGGPEEWKGAAAVGTGGGGTGGGGVFARGDEKAER